MTALYKINDITASIEHNKMYVYTDKSLNVAYKAPKTSKGTFRARIIIPYTLSLRYFPHKFWNLGGFNMKGDYIA